MELFGLRKKEEERVEGGGVGGSESWRFGSEWCIEWRVCVAMEEREREKEKWFMVQELRRRRKKKRIRNGIGYGGLKLDERDKK